MQQSQHNYILVLSGKKNLVVPSSSPTNKLDFQVKDNSIKLEKILKASAYAINTLRQNTSVNNKKDVTKFNLNEKEFSKKTAKNIINDLILLYKLNKPPKQPFGSKSSSVMSSTSTPASTSSSVSSSNDLNDLLNKAALKLNQRPNMTSGNPFSPRPTEEDLEVVNLTSSSHLMLPVSSHFQRRDFVKPNEYNSEDEPSIASTMNDDISSASNISKSLNLVDKLASSTLLTQNLQNRPVVITKSVEKKMEENFLKKVDEILDQHFPTQKKLDEEEGQLETNILLSSETESDKSNKNNSIDKIEEKTNDDNNNNNVSVSDSRSTVSPVEPLFFQLDQSVTASCCLEQNFSENKDNDIESVSISKSSSSSSISSSTNKEPENPIEKNE